MRRHPIAEASDRAHLPRFRSAVPLLLLVVAVVLSYLPAFSATYTNWDDNVFIVASSLVRRFPASLGAIFRDTTHDSYVPLTTVSFGAEHYLVGSSPHIAHAINVALHLLVTLLVYFLALQLQIPASGAIAAAFIFGLHPMHVESVAWLTERKDVLYSTLYLAALSAYLRFGSAMKVGWFALSLVLGFLSMLAKPMAYSLPFVMALCDWYLGRRGRIELTLAKVGHFSYMVPLAMITFGLHTGRVELRGLESVLFFVWTMMFYPAKFFLPYPLVPIYDVPRPVSVLTPTYAIALVALVTIIGAHIRYRQRRLLVFASAYYLLSIAAVLKVDSTFVSTIADRYMYLPSVGLCFLLGAAWSDARTRLEENVGLLRAAVSVFGGAVVVVLGLRTYAQAAIWQDSLTLWNHTLRFNPEAVNAYLNRGVVLADAGRFEAALEDFNKAIALKPGGAFGYNNRGELRMKQNQFAESAADFDMALSLKPDHKEAYVNRGVVRYRMRDYAPALSDFNSALELDPTSIAALNNRGLAYLRLNELDAGLADLDRALNLDAGYATGYMTRAQIQVARRDYDRALEDYDLAIALNPNNASWYLDRARLHARRGYFRRASEDVERSLKVQPSSEASEMQRQLHEAEAGRERARAAKP